MGHNATTAHYSQFYINGGFVVPLPLTRWTLLNSSIIGAARA
jgi:hypothetical protein